MSTKVESRIWTTADAGAALMKAGATFVKLFEHGTLEIEIYRPVGDDRQEPHAKNEVYVIIDGIGYFVNGNERTRFRRGDALFVRAGVNHRFEEFSPDFATWVFFYGPEGGE
jgi:mannose-6-phosphate isomerase-like protein (cupin superfamily)